MRESTSEIQLESSTKTIVTASNLILERSLVMAHKTPPKPAPKPASRNRSSVIVSQQQKQQQHVNRMSGLFQESYIPSPPHQDTPPQMQVLEDLTALEGSKPKAKVSL